jgi:uncharacterized protein (DUF1697 family)
MREDAGVHRYVALLRGVNVGGRNRIAMADLREVVTSLGHADVTTYIQSGNVVFTSPETDTATLADALAREVAERLGVQPAVVVLSAPELARVIADNPYPQETDPKHLHAVFRRQDMSADEIAAVTAAEQRAREKGSRDEAAVVGRTLYMRTPDGLGRSELAAQLNRAAAGTGAEDGTARNWATVTKLMTLLDQPGVGRSFSGS